MEIIGSFRATDELSLNLFYTYTNAEVTKGPLKGNRNEGTPQNIAGFSANYRAPFGLYLNARGRYLDNSFQDISNTALQTAISYSTFSPPIRFTRIWRCCSPRRTYSTIAILLTGSVKP